MADHKESSDRFYKGIYTRSFLARIYDHYVLGFNMKYAWGAAADSVLLPFFADNFSHRHMDIGVATGWFPATVLGRPIRNQERHQLTLVDFNETSLNATKARVLSVAPHSVVDCVQADITAALPEALQNSLRKYDTISMFNLFHCVPGGLEKLRAFATYKELLSDDGAMAGCTVLGHKHARGFFSRLYLRIYNRLDIFNNWDDDLETIEKTLRQEFEQVETEVVGMMLLFKASRPRRSGTV
ncbi:putative Methyltransferase [Seiridium unicorne]|uniref:Methyltransferase n=1 Tax=Seiridium unicorne TaxID=138068 RepID=A0ABR2UMF5_9PEZI